MSLGIEPTDKSLVAKRFTTAIGVRQQITMTMAEHDPELAFSFFNDSLSAISNPEFRKEIERQDSYFETRLLTQIAERDPAKAAQLGVTSIKKGVTYEHVELLRKIYTKDPEKGINFGAAIMSRLKSDKVDMNSYQARHAFFNVTESLLRFAEQTLDASRKPGAKPVYTNAEIRELVELLAQTILNQADTDVIDSGNVEFIQKYSPGRAAQIRAKFKSSSGGSRYSGVMANSANVISTAGYGSGRASNSNSNMSPQERTRLENEAREIEEREDLEKRTMEGVQALTTKELPKEEREKIIAQARKIISQTPGRDKKIMGLSMLATQVSRMGDKALATEIMRDAESMVNPSPKNYQDFILTWMLASGYATADPDKAFPLLEETIGRANDTLAAFVKVGEFVDVAEEMIQDGEVQVGAFGGQMVRGLTRELGIADATIQVLAHADFGKTKALTNRFDRAEIRILAKMMVLRAVLDSKKGPKPDVLPDGDVDY
jgi:hypothetical protein